MTSRFTVAHADTRQVAKMVADLIAEGQSEPAVMKLFNERFVVPRRTQAKLVIQASIDAGGSIPRSLKISQSMSPRSFKRHQTVLKSAMVSTDDCKPECICARTTLSAW